MARPWTHKDNFKFIEMYQNEPCIWNPKNKRHKDKVKVNEAWLRIADGLGVSVEDAKKKKETLLSAFRLNHKKVLASRKSAITEDEVFKPVWVYYDALAAFMADLYESKPVKTPEYQVKDEEDSPIHQTSYVYVPQASEESSGEERNASYITPRILSIRGQKRRRTNSPDRELQETNALVKDAVSSLNNVLSEYENKASEDECDLYGRLLAKKLRQFTELDRMDLMYQIDGMLLKKRKSLGLDSSS